MTLYCGIMFLYAHKQWKILYPRTDNSKSCTPTLKVKEKKTFKTQSFSSGFKLSYSMDTEVLCQ